MGGMVPNEGRVEVCVGGKWGTVCNNYFGQVDLRVVCRQLGFSIFGKYICNFHVYWLSALWTVQCTHCTPARGLCKFCDP